MQTKTKAEYNKEYREKNREALRKANREYYARNKEKVNQACVAYYHANKEVLGAKRRKKQLAKKQEIADRKRQHYQQNRERILADIRRRRELAKQNPAYQKPIEKRVTKYVEYCIFSKGNSFSVNVHKGVVIYVGNYKSLLVARIARNDALRKHGIFPPEWVKGFEFLPDDLKKQITKPIKEVEVIKPTKTEVKKVRTGKHKVVDIHVAIDVERKANKKKPKPEPTISFIEPVNHMPVLLGLGLKDNVYFKHNAWRVLITIKGEQKEIPASSSEDARAIFNRGGAVFKCKVDK